MGGDITLIQTVLDRLASRLPVITGEELDEVRRNNVVQLSRKTLLDLSRVQVDGVIHCIVSHLEVISRTYEDETPQSRPSQLLASQTYLAQLLADCCCVSWKVADGRASDPDPRDGARDWTWRRRSEPARLDESQAKFTLDVISKLASAPLADDLHGLWTGGRPTWMPEEKSSDPMDRVIKDLEAAVCFIFTYISATNWSLMYHTMQNKLKHLRQGPQSDENALSFFYFMPYMWLNEKKLSLVIQEIHPNFLILHKSSQNTIATLLFAAIHFWIANDPEEFVELHMNRKKLEGAADVLFDYASSLADNAKRRVYLWPLQTALVLLLPEVFFVAGMMGETKSNTITKKVYFLENLRKALRLPRSSDIAATCLVSICQAAAHFPTDANDSALLSFALDVQNEMREEIFKRQLFAPGEYEPAVEKQVMVDAFVSLCRLSMDSVVSYLIPRCLDKNAPLAFKVTVFAGASELARSEGADNYQSLYSAIAPALREYIQTLSVIRRHASSLNSSASNGSSISTLDRRQIQQLKNISSETIGSADLLYQILRLLKARPLTLFDGAIDLKEWETTVERVLSSLVTLLNDEDEVIKRLTGFFVQKQLNPTMGLLIEKYREQVGAEGMVSIACNFWKTTSIICLTLSRQLLDADFRDPNLRTMLELVHGFLDTRLNVLRKYKELAMGTDSADRSISNASLEVSLLILLCSSDLDICSLTTHAIGMLCEEGRITENAEELLSSNLTIMRNSEVYSELSLQSFRITGPVAFQKRLRRLLLRMKVPSPGILTAWEAVFMRWRSLCKIIMSPTSIATGHLDPKLHVEWRNYSGFLASIGGCCIADMNHDQDLDEEEEGANMPGHRWIDRTTSDGDSISLLERSMKECVQLLTCQLVNVRENMKEVLGSELNPKLYAQLFRSLKEELSALSDNNGTAAPLHVKALFAEQAASLLKIIVERTEETQDAFLTADLGELTLSLARFSVPGDLATVTRVRAKTCQLVELLAKKKEILNLRQDIRVRNALLAILVEWLSKPERHAELLESASRNSEVVKMIRDLDKACMKAIVHLLHRLPLQSTDVHHDSDLVDAKSTLYCNYFRIFLSLLDPNYALEDAGRGANFAGIPLLREEGTFQDLTIKAMSNLLSANVDVGLKYSLEIGYHEDLTIRTAFMQVLSNILKQGTEFNSSGDSAIAEKYELLVEMLVNDMDFAIAMCDTCPSAELDELATALLNIYDARGLSVTLLKELIEREVARTETEAILLRRNCAATKMLSVFARWKGAQYLRSTLGEVLNRLIQKFDDLNLELDPQKQELTDEQREQSIIQLQYISGVFIENIVRSEKETPRSFREICYTIANCAKNKFPGAKYTAVGAFIFLRFFCPAIVSPEQDGLYTGPLSKETRRGLVLITKVIQNLANNALFGVKETFMLPLNEFLTANIMTVTNFLRALSNPPPPSSEEATVAPVARGPDNFDFGSSVALHRFLYDHWEQVKRKLSHQEKIKKSKKAEEAARIAHDLDMLIQLVPSLGAPPQDVFVGKLQIASTIAPAYAKFQHFMLRNSGRSIESILSARIVYDGGESKDGMPVICIILRNINVETIDTDLYIYCFLKVASKLWHRPFGLLVDATCYSSQNELPDEVYRKLEDLMPPDMVNSFSRHYVYNMNTAYRKSFKRMMRHAMRDPNHVYNPNNVSYVLLGNIAELQTHFHLGSLHLPKDTISLVNDSRFTFERVVWHSRAIGTVDAVMKVGSQYLQITTTGKQEIFAQQTVLSASINDIFRLSDIDETESSVTVRGSSAIDEENRFCLKANRGKITMFFSSPRKNDILQAIKASKSKNTDTKNMNVVERTTTRPEDVPGTLLNVAFVNMATMNHALRLAAFDLFCTLCKSFNLKVDKQYTGTKGLSFPAEAVHFLVEISRNLAQNEARLTVDFLTEFFVGLEKSPERQRPMNLFYMVPWLENLQSQILVTPDGDYERGRERLATIARKLILVTLKNDWMMTVFLRDAWGVISKNDALLEVFLDELIKVANDSPPGSHTAEMISSIAASFTGVSIRGKVIARLRRFLHKTSLRPSRHLSESPFWNEIVVLLRLCLALSFNSKTQAEVYLPEVFHIVTLTLNCGQLFSRATVHALLVNTVQTIISSFELPEENVLKLKHILASLSEPKYTQIFNNNRFTSRDPGVAVDRQLDTGTTGHNVEIVATLLLEVIRLAAPSTDTANVWRARWMSLVASTSFQSNPAIQPRAFAVMGCLAKEEVDDDLLYQVLVALRTSLSRYLDTGDYEMINSVLIALTKMMENLSYKSRYIFQLFWIAVSLCRCGSIHIFNNAAALVEAVTRVINTSGEFRNGKMAAVLMAGRHSIEDTAMLIDELFQVSFREESFHHAMITVFIRGLHEPSTKAAALRALSTMMDIGNSNLVYTGDRFADGLTVPPYVGIVASRSLETLEQKELIATASAKFPLLEGLWDKMPLLVKSGKLRAVTMILVFAVIDFHTSEEGVQITAVKYFIGCARWRPEAFLLVLDRIVPNMNAILRNSQNPVLLEGCRELLCVIAAEKVYSDKNRKAGREKLDQLLKEWRMGGVWDCASFRGVREAEKMGMKLADKLIDVGLGV